MRLRWKRVSLTERLRPQLHAGLLSDRMVSSDPIRMFVYRWMIETGDPIEVVAKGFDVDTTLLRSIVSGEMDTVSPALSRRLASQMGVEESLLGDLERWLA